MTNPRDLFTRLRGKAKTGIFVEGLAFGAAAFIAFMVMSFLLDRFLRLEEVYRVSLLGAFVFGLWYLINKHLLRPLAAQLDDREMALAVERGEQDLEQALISAIQFEDTIKGGNPTRESEQMMHTVVSDVEQRVQAIKDGAALDLGRVRRFAGLILGCLAVVGTWAVSAPDSLILWAKRNLFMSAEEWPRATQLVFVMDEQKDGVVRLAEGNDLAVEVRADGVIPDQVFIHYELADGTSDRVPMARMGDAEQGEEARFTWLMAEVLTDVTELYATGGDGLTETLKVKMVARPSLSDVVITQQFPAYMKREDEPVNLSSGDLRVPAGVRLTVAGKSDKRLKKAFFNFGRAEITAMEVGADEYSFKGEFAPAESGALMIDVQDQDDLGMGKPPQIFLRVVKDQAPNVDFRTQGVGSIILYKAIIPGRLAVRDDFGITKVLAKLRITGGGIKPAKEGEEIPWEEPPFQGLRKLAEDGVEISYDEVISYDLAHKNDITKLPSDPVQKVKAGMLVQLLFEAEDNFGPGDPHRGASEVVTLRVVTQEKLMQDLNRRQRERRAELQQILEKQKVHRADIDENVSPTGSDDRASRARLRLLLYAKEQRNLTRQIQGVAERYQQILNEYFYNRILQPNQVFKQRQLIEEPLFRLYKSDFPDSVVELEDYINAGDADRKAIVVGTYDDIIKTIEEVITAMSYLEDVAGIIEELRRIRQAQEGVRKGTERQLDKLDTGRKEDKDKEEAAKKEGGK